MIKSESKEKSEWMKSFSSTDSLCLLFSLFLSFLFLYFLAFLLCHKEKEKNEKLLSTEKGRGREEKSGNKKKAI